MAGEESPLGPGWAWLLETSGDVFKKKSNSAALHRFIDVDHPLEFIQEIKLDVSWEAISNLKAAFSWDGKILALRSQEIQGSWRIHLVSVEDTSSPLRELSEAYVGEAPSLNATLAFDREGRLFFDTESRLMFWNNPTSSDRGAPEYFSLSFSSEFAGRQVSQVLTAALPNAHTETLLVFSVSHFSEFGESWRSGGFEYRGERKLSHADTHVGMIMKIPATESGPNLDSF